MSVTESIWAMVNLTLSALAVIWLTASYAKVAFQKTNKRANLLLLGYAAFLTICFLIVSYGVYGDVKYLILEKARSLYSLLFWTAIFFYYIFAYRKQPLFKRIFHSIICSIAMAFSDIISVTLLTTFDFIAKTDFCSLLLSDERWSHWYSFLGYILTPVIYFTFLFFFRKFLQKRQLHLTFESTKQNLILLIFPIAQAAIIATFTIIIALAVLVAIIGFVVKKIAENRKERVNVSNNYDRLETLLKDVDRRNKISDINLKIRNLQEELKQSEHFLQEEKDNLAKETASYQTAKEIANDTGIAIESPQKKLDAMQKNVEELEQKVASISLDIQVLEEERERIKLQEKRDLEKRQKTKLIKTRK